MYYEIDGCSVAIELLVYMIWAAGIHRYFWNIFGIYGSCKEFSFMDGGRVQVFQPFQYIYKS